MSHNIDWSEQSRREQRQKNLTSFGLLALRIGIGTLMLFAHGSPKLVSFSTLAEQFPDPLGLGGPLILVLAIIAQFFCSLAISLGFLTRWATIPPIILLLVAAFGVHGGDPFAKQELALVYLIPFIALAFAGPGRYSVDRLVFKRRIF